jgi:DNA-directed RNA polymerase beta subunit
MSLTPVLIDAAARREQIHEKATDGVRRVFPIPLRDHTVEIEDVRVTPKEYSSREQKDALLHGHTLQEPLKGTLVLKDAQGKVVQRKDDVTLAQLPWFTPRHTFIVDGNEYSVANQRRVRPGVYTRVRGNEELEAAFNLGRGENFRLSMDPAKGHLYLQYGTTNIPLYPVLRRLGVPDATLNRAWGSGVVEQNRSVFASNQAKTDKALDKLYERLVPEYRRTHHTPEAKAEAIHESYRNTVLDPEVTERTLGEPFTRVTPAALVKASKKILDVHREGVDTDDRDSLAFQQLLSADDFVRERILLEGRNLTKKAKTKAASGILDLDRVVPPSPFTRTLRNFVTNSSLASIPTQINPVEILDSATKVTTLGEGGIESERAIPSEARSLHHTHFGFIDPARTPESFHAGVDLRAAMWLKRDEQGRMHTLLRNARTGKLEDVAVHDVETATVALPGQGERQRGISALRSGKPVSVARSEIDYEMPHSSSMFSLSSNTVPMPESVEGFRLLMGAKHVGQALPLVHREAPLVQVASFNPGRTMEQEIARFIVPHAPVAGTVMKVDPDYIYIRPETKKHGAAGPYLYHYGPLDVDLSRDDLKSPAQLFGTPAFAEVHRKYRERAAEHHGKPVDQINDADILTYMERGHRGPGGSRMVSVLSEPIPPTALPALAAYAQKHPLYRIDYGQALKEGLIDASHVVEEQPRSQRSVKPADLLSELQTHTIDWSTDNGRLLFARRPHGFLTLKGGKLPGHLLTRIDEEKTAAAPLIKVPYDDHFPLSSKTFLHNDVTVKAGDEVESEQLLADSNFTRDGRLALGTNLRVGYLPWYGANTNDAVVISQDAAEKLTSEHMYKETMGLDTDTVLDQARHRALFGSKWTAAQYAHLDERGIARSGETLQPGDPIILALRKTIPTAEQRMLGKLHRTLNVPYREAPLIWDHRCAGEIVDVVVTPSRALVTLRTVEPAAVGDKVSNRYGGKGVISQVIPNAQMPHTPDGRALDLLMPPTGVHGRINPAQILETAVAKVAEKTGQPVVVESFTGRNNVKWARNLLKEHGLTDKEILDNPITGRQIKGPDGKGVMVGPQYIYKLFKSTETNYSARGVEDYDVNLQPAKGGATGAKALGRMEINALLAHNARNVLREATTLKSSRNDEFWRAYQLGLPLPPARTSFASEKFLEMLQGAGIKVDKSHEQLTLGPLTDTDVKRLSAGAVSRPLMVKEKDLSPEKGGLFDPVITGGTAGTRWAHVDLHEPLVNPTFEEPVRRLLGLTAAQFRDLLQREGGASIRRRLAAIDLDEREKSLREEIRDATGARLDGALKQLKAVQALKREDLTPDKAYVISKLGVVPPVIRPILPAAHGRSDLLISDANYLYRDAMLANDSLATAKRVLPPEEVAKARLQLYDATKAVFGLGDPVSPQLQGRGAKGFITTIAGQGSPKRGFFHGKVLYRPQDVSGRGTAVPDLNLNMDEIGVPQDMLWTMYGPHIVRRLVQNGYRAVEAQKMLEEKHPTAFEALQREAKERPVIVNRAPTLHRYSLVGAYPVPVPGKTLRVNPFIEKGLNLDYDGDTLTVHVPVMPGAVQDVKSMLLSNLLFGDKTKSDLLVFPQHEAVVGIHMASAAKNKSSQKHRFKTKTDAVAAYRHGEIALNDEVEIG